MKNLLIDILLNPILWVIVTVTLVASMIIFVVKSRYKIFSPNLFVIHFRRGVVKHKSYGGVFFKLPIIDQYLVLPRAIQHLVINASQNILTQDNKKIVIKGFLIWRIQDFEKAFMRIVGETDNTKTSEFNFTLEQIVDSIIRKIVFHIKLHAIQENRETLVNDLTKELSIIVGEWGISIEKFEITDFELNLE